jgi:hypothetical protein
MRAPQLMDAGTAARDDAVGWLASEVAYAGVVQRELRGTAALLAGGPSPVPPLDLPDAGTLEVERRASGMTALLRPMLTGRACTRTWLGRAAGPV